MNARDFDADRSFGNLCSIGADSSIPCEDERIGTDVFAGNFRERRYD